jgi:hypothetical protein
MRAVALLGSEHCGQTSWLIRGFDAITQSGERYRFPVDGQEQQWEEYLKTLNFGRTVPSTPGLPGVAWCLDFASNGACNRLYLFDIAGEEAADPRRLTRHRNFRYLDGLVLAIDPFGLDPVRRRYGHTIETLRPPVRPTGRPFGETHLSAILRTLEMCRQAPRAGTWDIPVAVLMTKMDVLGLGQRLGSEVSSTGEDIHRACRRQLSEWGFENMIRAIESHFRRVRFFGTWPGAQGPFAPGNALLWMFDETA